MDSQNNEYADSLPLSFSLLWPKGRNEGGIALAPETMADLDTSRLVRFIAGEKQGEGAVAEIFRFLCKDVETINYRLDIIDDLEAHPEVLSAWETLVPVIREMKFYTAHTGRDDMGELAEVIWRLRELEHYVACVERLHSAFEASGAFRSDGLGKLGKLVAAVASDPIFARLKSELPDLLSKINNLKSVTVGVNLNAGLLPCEATLVSINSNYYTEGPLHGRLVGDRDWKGIAQLHRAPEDAACANPLMIPLFRDVAEVLKKTLKPLAQALKSFISVNSRLIIKLSDDFLFYLGVRRLNAFLKGAGLPVTRPQILPAADRLCRLEDFYNVNLALHLLSRPAAASGPATPAAAMQIVRNDFLPGPDERIVILTGPNRGGKTTFLQAIGLVQIMAQLGIYVPAGRAALSAADAIFTHYPAREELEKGTGRFGEEAQRLASIFRLATRHSLVLLNESLASTSSGESLYLAGDIVRVLRGMGARAFFTTHIHQLAATVAEINTDTSGDSRVISMVARVEKRAEANDGEQIQPTFKIIPGPPEGRSYALDLAVRYGISKDQLISGLKDRGVID